MSNYENCQAEIKKIMRIARIEDDVRINILTALRENWKKEFNRKETPNDSKPLNELIEKWDEKRIDMLHWRRMGKIDGGIEQSNIIEEALKDLKGLRDL